MKNNTNLASMADRKEANSTASEPCEASFLAEKGEPAASSVVPRKCEFWEFPEDVYK